MKNFFLLAIMFVCALSAHAVPADNVTITHTQKDGTVLTLRLVGDEHMHYYQDVATGQAMRQGADGDFVVISSAELSAQAELASVRRATINQQRVARLPLMQQRSGMHKVGTIDKNLSGNKSVLVLLVAFSDKAFSGTQSDFDNQFNQQNYTANSHIGSVHDYFYDQSYGALNLSFDVYGPVTLDNTMEYYGANDANDDDVRPRQMVKEAVQKANTSYDIDFTKYDWDNDGKVDQVVVIYAGYAESQGAPANTIWPHQWELSGIGTLSGKTYDNKTINSYACLSELKGKTGSTRDGIGTFCHEFSHCLGLPDFYDTDYEDGGTANDMSYFDLMASGSYNGTNNAVPCGYTAYERWQFGWVTPTELSKAATITGMKPLNNANPDTYIIYNQKNRNEYFLLENRQSDRWFKYSSTYTAGHGLFITHCNYVSSYWTNNTINATAGDEHFVYVPANRSYSETSSNLPKAFFPAGATSFTDDSHSSCGGALWTNNADGTKKLGVPITDIAESNGLISFDVLGGMHDDGSRYTITLDACGGSVSQNNWSQTSYKQAWTLPEPTTTVAGWEGAGWSLTKVNSNTPLDDVDLIDYGKPYEPESNVTLYAVYYNEDFICNSYPANTHYTVTFDAGAGSCATASWTQTDQQQKTTLPTASISIDGWTFAGWATASTAETLSKPSLLAAGADYTPTANITLYAVYKKSTGGNGKISSVDEITEGGRYVFVISDGTTSYAVQQDASNNFVSFTESGEFASSIIWTAATSTNGYSFTCNSKYLYNSGDNTTINAASATATDWVFTALGNDLFKMQRTNTSGRYIGWSGSKFAGYANNNFLNQITDNHSLKQYDGALYIYKIGGSTTYNSNPESEVTPDPEPGDGGDEPGEGEGGDITITPISGIPAGYYNSTIVGKNDRTLELALKAIVNPHTHISYESLWNAFAITDVVPTNLLKDPAKNDQVYDMYADYTTFAKYYSDDDHSQTGGINREHCVPNSWWGGKTGNATAYTDLHHLVPGDGAANNAKSNHPLGEYKSGMTLSWPTETKTNTNGYTYVEADNTADHSGSWSHVWNTTSSTKIFEPANEFKGDFARMYLYVVCAYEGDLTWQTADNTMFSNGANNYTTIAPEAKALLLKWHRQDPVSDKERLRNNAVQSIQGNRNPFIDYPVLVEYVWGDSIAKATFSLERMPSAYQFGVTYHAGTNVTCDESLCLCDRGSSVTLPTASTTIEGWTFSGWTTSPIENTTTAPTLLTGNYTPTENVELYAVFQARGTYSITPEALEPETTGSEVIYFPHIAHVGQPFTAPAFNTNSDGAQTWTSSNPAVAEVDNEGHVTIKAVGTTIITVTQAETATYKQGTASYMIKVVE